MLFASTGRLRGATPKSLVGLEVSLQKVADVPE